MFIFPFSTNVFRNFFFSWCCRAINGNNLFQVMFPPTELNSLTKDGKLVFIESEFFIFNGPIFEPITAKAIAILWSKSVLISLFFIWYSLLGKIYKSSLSILQLTPQLCKFKLISSSLSLSFTFYSPKPLNTLV